ncbi:hypothetical protein CC1G_04753 [Coprinopsis cinerea okayama7|uniref:Uncharacterized protein n=1 Tax=Coprinopsis cinerea (strain Okayama-7 / 130 / ATCC MYA-4618 / FGSC 9003) TaxID=240176 RepID=A8P2F7_COPC7|nr:hypothetical protein CC1G_04753 [Coprinopsis cinerea okayama7\|eukprot:XP_001838309.1 hypothetical protein CC1G_04753 [Coprinopsis cinerea okayama7\
MSSSPIPPSPFEQHIGTNYTPHDRQLVEIQELVTQSKPRLAELDAELEDAMKAVEALRERRDKYKNFVDGHQALLSITRRLPLDIMHIIFEHAMPKKHGALMSPSDPPLLFTHVCREWRRIAINHAPLWSSLHLPIPNYPDYVNYIPGYVAPDGGGGGKLTEEQQAIFDLEVEKWTARMEERKSLVATWLSRAKGAKLSLNIYTGHWFDENTEKHFKELISILRGYASQWGRVHLSCPVRLSGHVLSIPASETPQLHSISLKVFSPTRYTTPFPISPQSPARAILSPDSLVSSPTLRSLLIECIPAKVDDIPAPWGNLTQVCLSAKMPSNSAIYFTSASALAFLQKCPNMRKCALTIGLDPFQRIRDLAGVPSPATANANEDDEERVPRVTLPHLHTLVIEQEGDMSLQLFIDNLDLPSLDTLAVRRSAVPCAAKPAPLVQIMRTWGRNLKALFFDYQELTAAELQTCLELSCNVEQLNVSAGRGVRRRYSALLHDFGPAVGNPADLRAAPALFTNSVLSKLTPQGDQDPASVLCPNLTSFAIRLGTAEFTEEALLDFIRGRRRTSRAPKLEKLKVEFAVDGPKRSPEDSYDKLQGEINWPMWRTVVDDPGVDLTRFKLDLEWGQSARSWASTIHNKYRRGPSSVWDPVYGLPPAVLDGDSTPSPFAFS